MKILLTGSQGNLGQALQRLGQKHRWAGLERGEWGKLTTLLRGTELVVHAASDLVTPVWQDPQAVMESNLLSTCQLLSELGKRPRRLVFISSCAVYGRSEVTSEELSPAPISINGITKLLNEEVIRDFCGKTGIEYLILRVFNTYGGRDRFSILSHLERSLKGGKPFTLNNEGRAQRDFIHVDDLASIILQLLEKPIRYPVINIATGETTRIRDIVTEFQKRNPALKVVSGQRPEAEYSRADITKLRQILPNYKFRDVLDFIRTS